MKLLFKGNTDRFAGQTSAKLLSAESAVSKSLPGALKQHYGADLPRGHCILCVYLGNFGVPFADISKYTITALDKLRGSIGQTFEIEPIGGQQTQPQGFIQEELDLNIPPQNQINTTPEQSHL